MDEKHKSDKNNLPNKEIEMKLGWLCGEWMARWMLEVLEWNLKDYEERWWTNYITGFKFEKKNWIKSY